MSECRDAVLREIERVVLTRSLGREILYRRALEYPLRSAKGIRPALCIAVCRALGGRLEAALPSAAALELYHNAFLVHDDVEDGSEKRRDEPTLHRQYGVPIAVNVGDAMLAMTLPLLLENTSSIGLSRALRVLATVARMASETAEGQAVELEWIKTGTWSDDDKQYTRMVYQKTCWYTFVAPVQVGAIVAGASAAQRRALTRFAVALGVAFQIQDDLLNLRVDAPGYGKEIYGDLWEGKRTLILMHALRNASATDRMRARAILAKARGDDASTRLTQALESQLSMLLARDEITRVGVDAIRALVREHSPPLKTEADVEELMSLVRTHRSEGYAQAYARRRAARAKRTLDATSSWMPPSIHRTFLEELTGFVVDRVR